MTSCHYPLCSYTAATGSPITPLGIVLWVGSSRVSWSWELELPSYSSTIPEKLFHIEKTSVCTKRHDVSSTVCYSPSVTVQSTSRHQGARWTNHVDYRQSVPRDSVENASLETLTCGLQSVCGLWTSVLDNDESAYRTICHAVHLLSRLH